MTDAPITTAREALEAAIAECHEIEQRVWDSDVARGAEMCADAIRALASRIPEPGENDVERVRRAICRSISSEGEVCDGACPSCSTKARAAIAAMRPAEGWRPMRHADFGHGDKGDLWVTSPRYPEGYRVANCEYLADHGPGNFTGWVCGEGFNEGDPVEDDGRVVTHWMPLPAAPAQGGRDE